MPVAELTDAPPVVELTDENPINSPEVVSRLKSQMQSGDVGRQSQSMDESREGLGRGVSDVAERIHDSATKPGGLLNAGEWADAAKNFLPTRVLNRLAGNPPDQPFIPKDWTDQVNYAFKTSAGDMAAWMPGATPAFRKSVEGEVKSVGDTVASLANPDMAVGGELVKMGGMTAQVIKTAFAMQMASEVPEAYNKTVHALKYGDEEEISKSLSDLAIETGLPLAIVGESMGKPKQPMDYHGSQIPMPKGAEVPPRKVYQMPEGVESEMQQIEKDIPATQIPGRGPSFAGIKDTQIPGPKRVKPVVPENSPEPEREIHVLDEIRQKGLKTRRQIQSLFPHLSNEEAADLRNQAFGKPVPAPPKVAPEVVEAVQGADASGLKKSAQAASKKILETANPVETPVAELTDKPPIESETPNASSQQTPAEVHGNVRPLETPPGQLPVQESVAGVQPRPEVQGTHAAPEKSEVVPVPKSTPAPDLKAQEPEAKPVPVQPIPGQPAPAAAPTPVAESPSSSEGKGPGMASMGGLAPGDPTEPVGKGIPSQTAGYGGDIYGVAQRVRDARAKAGQVAPVATGEGVSPKDAIEWGRELLRNGLDADKMQDEIEKTGKISFDAAAATRAHGEDLAQAARNIEGKFGTDSPEYKIAQKALNDWDARTKGQGTIWHKIGMSMQGETDIDTGTFTGLQRAFKADVGKDFTPSQSVKAKKIAADNAKASAESEAAKKALYAKADEPPMSPKQKAIIEKAIAFLDKAADDALSRIRARRSQGRAFSVGDPNDLDDYVIYGAAKIAKGTVEFGKWSAEMATELGDYIKPYLKSIWDAADNIDKQIGKITDAQTAQAAKQAVRKSPAKPKSLDEIKKVLAGHVQGQNWSPEQVHALWQHVKTYLDKGMDDYGDIRNKVATDLGLPVSEVNRGLTQNKATKRLADDVWRKQHTERMMKQHAKRWLGEQQFPALIKAARMVPRLFFGAKVFGHGTVALGTHAPMVFFQPNYWGSYIRDFGKMYHMVGSTAFHEMQMTDLMHRPNYTVARRAGLVNDPLSYEDFNSPDMNAFANEIFGQYKAPGLVKKGESAARKIAGAGNRGYSVLKLLRQDMFDQRWEALPETAKTPEVAQAISDGINHATGVTKKSGLPGLNIVFFAPRLEASRIAWLSVDPAKAGKTFATWSHATDAEKQFAINQVKEKATVIATMGTLLALNQGLLTAAGSKQKINFDNPMQSDWLKFKALGMDASYGNSFITMVRLPVRLNSIRKSDGGKLRNVIYPDESMSNEVFKYARTQLGPLPSFLANIAFKGDYAERPLPEMPLSGPAIPLKKRLRAEGVEPYTWKEFLIETALPIPAEEAAREVFKGFQMDEEHQKTYLKALATIGLMAGTGGRVSEDWTLKK